MLIPAPPLYPRRPKPAKKKRARPPAALTLVAAEYVEAATIRLTFDRPIDIAGMVGAAILVNDPTNGTQFAATGTAMLIDPATLQAELVAVQDWTQGDVSLWATAGTGIVALDDGGMWAGASDVELPFA